MFKKSLIISFAIITLLALFHFATPAHADLPTLIPDNGYKREGDYQLADIVSLALNAASIIMAVAASLALLAFVIGGVIFLVSSGNPEMLTRGRNTIMGAIIGLFIIFFSWTIVDFTLSKLGYDSSKFGVWYERPGRVPVPPKTVVSKGQTSGPGVSTTGFTHNWTFQNNSKNQVAYASAELTNLMDCIGEQALADGIDPAKLGSISSIVQNSFTSSDLNNLASSYCNTCPAGKKDSKCIHVCQSCHYGGGTNSGKSYAIDFGSGYNSNLIKYAQNCTDQKRTGTYSDGSVHFSVKACPRDAAQDL